MEKVFIIAEIGNNHNGCFERAERLINHAKACGADAVKFQLRNFGELYRCQGDNIEDLGVEYTKEVIQKYEFQSEMHRKLKEICDGLSIEYMCTPWDHSSLEVLLELGVGAIKIASADFDNLSLIEAVVRSRKKIYLSTGMSSSAEIREVSDYLIEQKADFTLLHCNSTYPAPFQDIQLNYLKELQKITPNVGYSGHERGVSVSVAAVALGARVIERHLTEDKELEGPDHQASLLPSEFKQMITMIREVEMSLGDPDISHKVLSQGVRLNRENLGKSLVYKSNMDAGDYISENSFEIKSPGQGISPLSLRKLVGRQLLQNVFKNDFVFFDHFQHKKRFHLFKNMPVNWGIPVRPHDFLKLHKRFNAEVYEFHISYSDLNRDLPEEDWSSLKEKRVVVHAPELFENSELLDLCSADEDKRKRSIENLQRVIDFSSEISRKIGIDKTIGIVSNVGGFSTHQFRENFEKPILYEMVSDAIRQLDWKNTKIYIQNMAPYPWHFGGQRFQNIFCEPGEIIEFCNTQNVQICLDTAHLSMFSRFQNKKFETFFDVLLPITAHLHMSDASGLNGEGVELGSGDIDFHFVMKRITEQQTFIVETWQGHKALGAGFLRDLEKLEAYFND